ncbi:MAG: hypothetical protein A3J29_20255 [Acidobacteria bacterium RIFCSPLOWO2_12_FULL_67_14b]|nr:MAG: hypothetical protein A3J29_20255 [Acidobacteria bacterium RIFCSPLOWO2_12_FULL_67_14b]
MAVHRAFGKRRGVQSRSIQPSDGVALVGLALSCAYDLTTVGAWAREAGMCETQLRLRCRIAGVPAKVSLDFVRVLRAGLCREVRGGALTDYLDVGDPRTMRRLLARVGRSGPDNPTVLEYVSAQRVIRDVALIEELKKVLTPMATFRHHDGPHH